MFFVRRTAALLTCLILLPGTTLAGTVFQDDFEGANMSAAVVHDLPTNRNGFTWSTNNRTSVIRVDETGRATAVWRNGVISEPLNSSNWRIRSGSHALRFLYRAYRSTSNSDDWHWSEQRFSLGTPMRDLWMRFWLRVPDNYIHEAVDPYNAPNSKGLSIWPNQYDTVSSGEPTFIWGWWPTPGGSTEFTLGGLASGGHAGDVYASEMGIRVPEDRGRWMQVVFHLRYNSSPGVPDGRAAMWRRWEGEGSFTLLAERTINYEVPTAGNDGWTNGYLLGYANGGYAADTEFLMDDFTVSTSSLLVNEVTPKPPAPLSVQ